MKQSNINVVKQKQVTPLVSRRVVLQKQNRPTILIVDDDPSILRGMRRLLSRQWNVETANNARSAWKMLQTNKYTSIVTDYDMPGNSGLWLLNRAAKECPDMRRIMLSGSDFDIFTPHIVSGLVQEYLPKPATAEILIKLLS